jgi:hypothetical protein
MTYTYYAQRSLLNNEQFLMETDGVEIDNTREYNHSVTSVKYYGTWITLSQIVPLKIYNETAYSLVAETNFFNEFNFYTEKIVKPILGKRLFIVVSGQNYLRNLRNMGFKTFDGIVDETYDTIADNEQRWSMALNEVSRLSAMDQTTILEKIKPIVEYNYGLIANKNWYNETLTQLTSEIHDISELKAG